jgi:hypothetical protein
MKKILVSIFMLAFFIDSAYADCIPVSGLQFERISCNELLASRDGKNIAVLSLPYSPFCSLPTKMNTFRFFSEQLCTTGAEARFHIDGELFYLGSITYFKR